MSKIPLKKGECLEGTSRGVVFGKRSSLVSSCNTAAQEEEAMSTRPNEIDVQMEDLGLFY